jgi:hypothetical protein
MEMMDMALKISTGLQRQMLGGVMGAVTTTASLEHGILRLYSGTQPASADAAATGTLLMEITVASGAFVHGSETNGLDFELSGKSLIKSSSEVWSGVGLAAAGTGTTVGWCRFCGNPTDAGGISTTLPRIDGRVSTTGAELNLSNLTIVSGASTTVDSWSLAFPSTL